MFMLRVKDVYYKNRLYKIPIEDLKYINGYDIAKLPSEIYVYYDDLESKWKPASKIQTEEYTGKRYIKVELNGEIVETLSYIDLEEEIEDKKLTKVKVEFVVIYDSDKKVWNVLHKSDKLYELYNDKQS